MRYQLKYCHILIILCVCVLPLTLSGCEADRLTVNSIDPIIVKANSDINSCTSDPIHHNPSFRNSFDLQVVVSGREVGQDKYDLTIDGVLLHSNSIDSDWALPESLYVFYKWIGDEKWVYIGECWYDDDRLMRDGTESVRLDLTKRITFTGDIRNRDSLVIAIVPIGFRGSLEELDITKKGWLILCNDVLGDH